MLLVSDRLLALNSELQQLEIFARQAREQIASRCVAGSRTRTVFQDEIERLDVERSPSDTGDFGNCGSWVPRIKLEDADNDKTGSASLATANWLNYSEEAEGYQLSRSRPKEVCQVLSDTSIECLPIREHETTGRPETFQVAESLEMQQIGSGHTQPSVARPFPYRAEVALHRPPTHFSHIQQNKLTDYQGKTLEVCSLTLIPSTPFKTERKTELFSFWNCLFFDFGYTLIFTKPPRLRSVELPPSYRLFISTALVNLRSLPTRGS